MYQIILCSYLLPIDHQKRILIILMSYAHFFENIYYSHPNATIWFGGDMNLPDIDWNLNTFILHQYRSCINERFIDFMANCGLSQFVTFPTHNNNILDIFATNKPGQRRV